MTKLHAPSVSPSTGRLDAYCRFIHWPLIACLPEDVTCGACITKMTVKGVPRKGWAPIPKDRLWPSST